MGEQVDVHRNDENHHYEATLDGKVVGFVRFRHRPGQIVLIHTETDPAYEGRGVGSALARGALDDVRARGEKAVLKCEFIASYVQQHPEYQDLVAPADA
jgi:predicted GNAT family acetyltransferase